MNFFFDRCIAVRLARMLQAYDSVHTIVHLDDDNRFTRESKDVDIINLVGAENPKPVYLTADLNNQRDPAERAALRESGMSVVFFRGRFHSINIHVQAVKLLTIWPLIVTACDRCREPTTFEITPAANTPNRYKLTRDL